MQIQWIQQRIHSQTISMHHNWRQRGCLQRFWIDPGRNTLHPRQKQLTHRPFDSIIYAHNTQGCMMNKPTLYVIETAEELAEVTAMDWRDAVETWITNGGAWQDVLSIFEYATPGVTDTIH